MTSETIEINQIYSPWKIINSSHVTSGNIYYKKIGTLVILNFVNTYIDIAVTTSAFSEIAEVPDEIAPATSEHQYGFGVRNAVRSYQMAINNNKKLLLLAIGSNHRTDQSIVGQFFYDASL